MSPPLPDVSVVVPTRNEEDNIAVLIERLDSHMADLGRAWEAIVVDDSDDTTPTVVEQLRHQGRACRLIHRPPTLRSDGLAGAVLLGMANAAAEVIAVMDGDLQHPPELLGALTEPLLAGEADVSVGTRYVDGGAAAGLDGPFRRAVSVASRDLSKAVLPRVRHTSDPCSGFFAVRRSVVDGVELRPVGFKILLEILVRGRWRQVRDVPYTFDRRVVGASKAGLDEGLRFGRHLRRLVAADRSRRRAMARAGV